MSDFIPKWHKELEIFSKIKPLIIVEGNILDVYSYPEEGSIAKGSILRLAAYMHYFFKDLGYQNIVFYDSMQGFYNTAEEGYIERFGQLINQNPSNGRINANFKSNNTVEWVKNALSQSKEATAIIMNLASRYISSPDNMDQSEVDSFTSLLISSLESKDVKTDNGMLKNILIMIVNKVNDIPVWFYHDNPNVKTITLPTPSKEERENFVKGPNFATFFAGDIYVEDNAYFMDKPDELEKIQDKFIALTEGFSFTELNGLRKLCKNEGIHMNKMCDVIDLYKYGIKENPWNKLETEEFKNADVDFRKRVKGQDGAITKTLDVIKRAMTGMSGLQHSSHSKPKGVLFFAGPTGTGKTETAKTLAEKLFGDESCCIRFDMSEYGQSHSDQKLLGAPPGYVGYEAGGQLTNAVKSNPFSILLFDEIEKAHPSILDKFLQILEDGRMTDGQGNTVYFSECIIIFTSNLGIYTRDASGVRAENVNSTMDYATIQKRVRSAIEDYFKLELGRPEILNRIGENIVVFDYIRPDVAKLILESQVTKIIRTLATEKKITLEISDIVMNTLLEESVQNLSNGARGIGNIVESMLINPLSRYLFDNNIAENTKLNIKSSDVSSTPTEMECEVIV